MGCTSSEVIDDHRGGRLMEGGGERRAATWPDRQLAVR
jgi:hypothetical protein